MMKWWGEQTTPMKLVYGYLAISVAVAIGGAVIFGPGKSTPKPPKPQAAERTLSDAEVEANWNAQMDAAKREWDAGKQGAADAWDAAKLKFKRMWIEGQREGQ